MDIQKAKFMKWLVNEYIEISELAKEFSVLPKPYFQKLEKLLDTYLVMLIKDRYWPLHPNEVSAAQRERRRIDDSRELYALRFDDTSVFNMKILQTTVSLKMFSYAEKALWIAGPYTDAIRETFLSRLNVRKKAVNNNTLRLNMKLL